MPIENNTRPSSPQHMIAMERLDTPDFGINTQTATRVNATPNYVCAIVTSSIFIFIAHFGHAIGLLYADHVLMKKSGLDYSPTIYFEAIPGFVMVVLFFVPFMCFKKWKSALLGKSEASEDIKYGPIIMIMSFAHSVVINIFAYSAQVLVILVQVYLRHIARLPSGDRCSCYHDDVSYLVHTVSVVHSHQCICYLPSFPHHARSVRLITDDIDKLTPSALEKYVKVEAVKPFDKVVITEHASSAEYEAAYERERLSQPYTTVIILLMCNLLVLAIRLSLWIKLKELWTESEKLHLAKQITSSSGSIERMDRKPSFKTRITAACEVAKMLERLDKTYEEKKRNNVKVVFDEFTFAFLEGTDAFALYLDMMDYAHVDPKSPLLTAALVFICLDVLLVNWDNALNSVPGNGDRISNYVRAVSALLINLPFFIIRVLLFMDEGRSGFPFLLLVLFLMKEVVAFCINLVDVIQMLRTDCHRCMSKNKVQT